MTHITRRFAAVIMGGVLVFSMLYGSGAVFSQEEVLPVDPQAAANPREDAAENAPAPDTMDTLRDRNNELTKLYGELKIDRDNLLAQSKRLLEENKTYGEIKKSSDEFAEQKQLLLEHKDISEKKIQDLESNFQSLKMHISQLTQERNELKKILESKERNQEEDLRRMRAQIEVEYKEMIDKVTPLKKENQSLKEQLEKSRKDLGVFEQTISQGQSEADALKQQVALLDQQNQKLIKENMHMLDETRSFPSKFTEMAAQNQQLIDQTADMHYNLGVFYVNNKEYKRALQEFEKTLELRPNDADTHYNLGYIYAEHLIDRPKAILYFKKYLTYAPDAHDADWVNKYLLTWQTWYGQGALK